MNLSYSQFNGKVSESLSILKFFIELGLLDYPKVIQHPMDFDTLKQNMYAGKFSSYEEFLLEF